ncbi:DNA N-6-adenine-methyltransferase [uncultured Halorubrum sp.]|uniref:DNA N-6-adenine-methyltransferase n=1 Tax=uncultured Halorubrum sp. TaxID=399555 RepID=UPI002612D1DD|nr:DNA N-6-adenine-methyltransferase [uncultured Halorubrum sp.]
MSDEKQQQAKSKKDDWQTPEWLWKTIDRNDEIDLDPCPGVDTEIGNHNIDPRHHDGLDYPWEGTVFVNPPYSEKADWLEKVVEETKRNTVDTIYVITPDSTDVGSWWHKWIAPHASHTIFFEHRVKFVKPETGEQAGNPPGGTALHIFGKVPHRVIEAFQNGERGVDVVTRASRFD